jgi:hypothetical protein
MFRDDLRRWVDREKFSKGQTVMPKILADGCFEGIY